MHQCKNALVALVELLKASGFMDKSLFCFLRQSFALMIKMMMIK